jgi:hypothetical protein
MHNRFLGPIRLSTSCVCYRIPNFPWRSHALWFIDQMRRWGYVGADVDPIAASAIFRPDVFVQAAGPLGLAVPEAWVKSEGSHSAVWLMPATPAPIPMGPDRFMDDALFDPANLDKWYPPRTLLKSFYSAQNSILRALKLSICF